MALPLGTLASDLGVDHGSAVTSVSAEPAAAILDANDASMVDSSHHTALAIEAPPSVGSKRHRSGRKPSPVWEFFTVLRTEHNKVHARCNFCAFRCAGVASRMVHHLIKKCPAVPEGTAQALASEGKRRRPAGGDAYATMSDSDSAKPIGANAAGSQAAWWSGSAASTGIDQTTALVHQKIVLSLLMNEVPLSVVEDAHLNEALQLLRPGFRAMTKDAAASAVLQQLHDTATAEIAAFTRDSNNISLQYDPPQQGRRGVWRGVDEHRSSEMLVEHHPLADGVHPHQCCLPLNEFLATVSKIKSRQKVGATLGYCSACPQFRALLYQLERAPSERSADVDQSDASHDRFPLQIAGSCLARVSARLLHELLSQCQLIVKVLQEATHLADALPHHPDTTKLLPTNYQKQGTTSAERDIGWLHVLQLVRGLLDAEHEIREHIQHEERFKVFGLTDDDESTSDAPLLPPLHRGFWQELRDVDALLQPFAWIVVLSETDVVTSSEFLLLWLWWLARIDQSPLVSSLENNTLQPAMLRILNNSIEDHHLVALLLDPRVRGAGLSSLGVRKAKALVVQVAQQLFPDTAFDPPSAEAEDATPMVPSPRRNLLSQLVNFVEQSSQFGDLVSWELVAGKAPELFWKDYLQDAQELARVARTVLTFTAQVHTVAELTESGHHSPRQTCVTTTTRAVPPLDVFATQQVKEHYAQRFHRHDRNDMAVVTQHATLLLQTPNSRDDTTPESVVDASSTAIPQYIANASSNVDLLERLVNTNTSVNRSTHAEDEDTIECLANCSRLTLELSWLAIHSTSNVTSIENAVKKLLVQPSNSIKAFATTIPI